MSSKPKKSPLKEVKTTYGGSIKYSSNLKSERLVRDLVKALEVDQTKQAALSEKIKAKEMPDLTPMNCLVAFIDILGFGSRLERANSKADLEAAYEVILTVQKEFQKETAADDPQEQAELNANYGRRVVALSDAVVVVFFPGCNAAPMMADTIIWDLLFMNCLLRRLDVY